MSNVLGTVWCIKYKLSGCAKRDVRKRKKAKMKRHSMLTATITTAATFITTTRPTTEAKVMKMKLSGNVEGDDELYQKVLFRGGF
jgi:hypothetical protein